jgi:hypothetical protein
MSLKVISSSVGWIACQLEAALAADSYWSAASHLNGMPKQRQQHSGRCLSQQPLNVMLGFH